MKTEHLCYIIANDKYDSQNYQQLKQVDKDIKDLQDCLYHLEFKKIQIFKNKNHVECLKIFQQIHNDVLDTRYVNYRKPIVFIVIIGLGILRDQLNFASTDLESYDYFVDIKQQLQWIDTIKNGIFICLCDLMKDFNLQIKTMPKIQIAEKKQGNEDSSGINYIVGNRSQDGKESSIQTFIETIMQVETPTIFHSFMFEQLRKTAKFNVSASGSENYLFFVRFTIAQIIERKCCSIEYEPNQNFQRVCHPYFSIDSSSKYKFELYDKDIHGKNSYYGKESYYGWKQCGDRLSLCQPCYLKLDKKWQKFLGDPDNDLL